jgi:hypothetical protein
MIEQFEHFAEALREIAADHHAQVETVKDRRRLATPQRVWQDVDDYNQENYLPVTRAEILERLAIRRGKLATDTNTLCHDTKQKLSILRFAREAGLLPGQKLHLDEIAPPPRQSPDEKSTARTAASGFIELYFCVFHPNRITIVRRACPLKDCISPKVNCLILTSD